MIWSTVSHLDVVDPRRQVRGQRRRSPWRPPRARRCGSPVRGARRAAGPAAACRSRGTTTPSASMPRSLPADLDDGDGDALLRPRSGRSSGHCAGDVDGARRRPAPRPGRGSRRGRRGPAARPSGTSAAARTSRGARAWLAPSTSTPLHGEERGEEDGQTGRRRPARTSTSTADDVAPGQPAARPTAGGRSGGGCAAPRSAGRRRAVRVLAHRLTRPLAEQRRAPAGRAG